MCDPSLTCANLSILEIKADTHSRIIWTMLYGCVVWPCNTGTIRMTIDSWDARSARQCNTTVCTGNRVHEIFCRKPSKKLDMFRQYGCNMIPILAAYGTMGACLDAIQHGPLICSHSRAVERGHK